ncbi:transposase [Streptomyces sp. NPDC056512]|uniref:transposase n=1 Tax=Streptomyces sp. NPDC056512 TaxID=3345846 RepID=UPI0036AE38BB
MSGKVSTNSAGGIQRWRRPSSTPNVWHSWCENDAVNMALDVWIADVRLDGQRELRTLANGMRRDRAAIQAALTTTYASGAVEGNVTRIKLLKRQMYGRANFDLLRRRILLSP